MTNFQLAPFSPSASSDFTLLAEEVTPQPSTLQARQGESVREPDVWIYVDGTALDARSGESASLGSIVRVYSMLRAGSGASAGASALVRAFSALRAREGERAALSQVVRVNSELAAREGESATLAGYVIPPTGTVESELHAREGESASLGAIVRVYSTLRAGSGVSAAAHAGLVRVFSELRAREGESATVSATSDTWPPFQSVRVPARTWVVTPPSRRF